jgi:hypothetical protein
MKITRDACKMNNDIWPGHFDRLPELEALAHIERTTIALKPNNLKAAGLEPLG